MLELPFILPKTHTEIDSSALSCYSFLCSHCHCQWDWCFATSLSRLAIQESRSALIRVARLLESSIADITASDSLFASIIHLNSCLFLLGRIGSEHYRPSPGSRPLFSVDFTIVLSLVSWPRSSHEQADHSGFDAPDDLELWHGRKTSQLGRTGGRIRSSWRTGKWACPGARGISSP
jgi:hypothetical protein